MSHLTDELLTRFREDGYVVVPQLLSPAESGLLGQVARRDQELAAARTSRRDGEGGAVDLVVRNDLPDDSIYGAIVRMQPLVDLMEFLLDDEVYHYHHKMILKEPRVGGAWTWHQDYGYWYNNGCLFPDMASCMIAVDRATQENGCLQVLRGSHRMGRVDHVKRGRCAGREGGRCGAGMERLDLVHGELEPGSAGTCHGNTLHRCDQNRREHPRWAFSCCYNRRHNNPWKEARHPRYSPLDRWPQSRIGEVGRAKLRELSAADGNG